MRYCILLFIFLVLSPMNGQETANDAFFQDDIVVGAERFAEYLPLLEGKTVAAVVNQTSMVGSQHLVDVLQTKGVLFKHIFAPEHGFRGKEDAGAHIADGKDPKSGLSVFSLHGKSKKPSPEQLEGIDLVIFDIQDVGARFYTYISTMHYVMEACAEQGITVLILDRPNPNGHYVAGPIRKEGFDSFVGMHPIPIVHGLTVGELACMVNEESWLAGGKQCKLDVIPCENYTHQSRYRLPVKPSPNLPNMKSIYLYPSLCLFEATNASVGRGTDKQFQVIGVPKGSYDFEFVPAPKPGAMHPKLEGQKLSGIDFSSYQLDELYEMGLDLSYLFAFEKAAGPDFVNPTNFFNKLAGTDQVLLSLENGSWEELERSWEPELTEYRILRAKYLLYPEN
ncbi:DUF1343 domain-containing protein [Chitinophagales bacterium]|nr:DUF1343 domain-containing protein [Chitinophagales bacterium]